MVPHDTVQGACCSTEAGQAAPGPRDGVGDASSPEVVELALVAVSQGIAKLDQILVVGLVASPADVSPPMVVSPDPPLEASYAEPPEVLLDAANVGVASIEEPPFGGRGDEERAKLRHRSGELDHPLGAEIVKVANECLELGDDPEHVGVTQRSADRERASRSIDLTHGRVRCGQRVDRIPSWSKPRPQRDGPRVRHMGTVGATRRELATVAWLASSNEPILVKLSRL